MVARRARFSETTFAFVDVETTGINRREDGSSRQLASSRAPAGGSSRSVR